MMIRKLQQLRTVFCRYCHQQHRSTTDCGFLNIFMRRFSPGQVAQTSYVSGILSFQSPQTTKCLHVRLGSSGLTSHSFYRPLSTVAANNGHEPHEESPRFTKQSYQDSRGAAKEKKPDHRARQSYSASKRYTSREVEAEVEEAPVEDEADTFGTLSNTDFFKESEASISSLDLEVTEDERDWKRERQRQNTPHWYASKMKKMVKRGELAEAIDFLENRMLKVDYVKPIEYNYDVLIGACGRAGYTKKAFKLFNRMKERGLHPSSVTYTSLFNACAESPWPLTDGYERVKKLHRQLKEKDIKVNLITTHAMIKAYGKCGDIEGAFHLFHHLLSSGAVVTRSFASILIACASNKEAGFTYAIEAWRQMLARGLQPDKYCFNLLLRIARDCDIGNPETAGKLLLKPVTVNKSQLLAAGKGKKGKRKGKGKLSEAERERTMEKSESSPKEIDKMITLPAALIKDVSDDVSLPEGEDQQRKERLGNLEDFGDDVEQDQDIRERTNSSPSGGANTWERLAKDQGWEKIQVDRPEDIIMNNFEPSGKLIEGNPWWQETDKVEENSTVQDELLPLNQEIRTMGAGVQVPNLLDQNANFANVESLASIQTPSDRLALIGGVDSVLQQMKKHDVKPNIKTFSMFTDLVPMTTEDENKLLTLAEDLGLSLDVDFYNMVIHRRTKRGDLAKAKEILPIMTEKGLQPNLRTYANLAIECPSMDDGKQLLEDMKNSKLVPNEVVYGALMGAAWRKRDYRYLAGLMAHMKEVGVRPNRRIVELLESAATFKPKQNTGTKSEAHMQDQQNRFRGFYYKWLAATEAAAEPHPWDAFTHSATQVTPRTCVGRDS